LTTAPNRNAVICPRSDWGNATDDVLTELDHLIRGLERASASPTDPANEVIIERWLIETYRRQWDETRRQAGLD
jgi:hypothetical protein